MRVLFYVFILMFLSCQSKKQTYVYVEEVFYVVEGKTEIEEEIFESLNDSTAYFDAYKKFLVSKKVNKMMEEMKRDALKGTVNEGKRTVFDKELKSYRLYNELGVEISKNVSYEGMEDYKVEMERIASELGNY